MWSTLFLILPISFNGATISLLPYQFHLVGIVLATILFLLSSVVCIYAGFLIVSLSPQVQMDTANTVKALTYHELAQRTLGECKCCKQKSNQSRSIALEKVRKMCGKFVSSLMAVMNCICLMGAGVAGVVFNKNVAAESVKVSYEGGGKEPPELLTQSWVWALVFIWGTLFPPLTCPRVSCIKYISYITSGLCVLYIFIVVWGVFHFPRPSPSDVDYFKPDVESVQIAFTLFLYPLLYQPNIQTIFHELERPTIRRTTVALTLDTAIVFVTYLIIGLLGYIPFAATPALKEIIIEDQNIFKAGDFAVWTPNRVYGILFLSTTLTLILSCLFPVKMVLLEFFGKAGSRSCGWNALASIALCIVLLGFSLAINETSLAIRIIGVTFYPIMCFVFPALFYILAPRKERLSRCQKVHFSISIVMCVSISMFAIFGFYQVLIVLSQAQ